MSQLKDLACMIMYLIIFVMALKNRNIIAVTFIIILFFNHIKMSNKIKHFEKTFKEHLHTQREFFINSLSHDLRIPTIAQIRAIELIKNETMGTLNKNQKDMLLQVEESCKCILNLISLMINIYSIENEAYKLIYEKFNISDIIISCFDELLPQASEKQITFEYNVTDKNLNITADKEELKKVILNILKTSISNAITGEKVSVLLSSLNNKIRLTFTSNSKDSQFIGINKNYTSIGHSIRMGFCKKIIETHHGQIIKNTNKNTFCFELPQYINA